MRITCTVVVALALLIAPVPSRARAPGMLVAQLASGAAGAVSAAAARPVALEAGARPAALDAAAVARALPRLAALGLSVRRGLLDGLPAPTVPTAMSRGAAPVAGLAFDRVVLLEAADSAAADAARQRLVDEGLVDWVEPLSMRHIALVSVGPGATPSAVATLDSLPNDPLLRDKSQWGVLNFGAAGGSPFGGVARADVHAIEGWRLSVGADDVRLAVADTGIDPGHPELGGRCEDGTARIVDGLDVTGEPVPAIRDSESHGTLVAGVMAARTNDGARILGRGIAGVCGGDGETTAGCRIVPIRITPGHSAEASSFDIARAILHATDVGARAMNLSYAGSSPSRIERLALTYAITRGCVVVAAAGNDGWGPDSLAAQYPAAYAADGLCIQVGASDPSDARVSFSSFGPGLDLVAPGVNIWSTFTTYPTGAGVSFNGYIYASGTSFAAPFVTGAVGLLAAARPELIDADFQHILRESADDIEATGVDKRTGWGRLDLGRALDAVRPELGIWHDEVAAQSLVPDDTDGLLTIGERGPGTLDRFSGSVVARRFAALATVTLPDSFVDSVRVWPRVGGTMAARGDFQLPYFTPTAQVIASTGRTFTLRGWVYRADEDACADCPDPWIPLPPEYLRFGFTVIGRVRRGHAAVPDAPPVAVRGLFARPNPFRDVLQFHAPGPGRVVVLDAGGRVVRSFRAPGGDARWDGRDNAGRTVSPGLYFIRWQGAHESRVARAMRLSP